MKQQADDGKLFTEQTAGNFFVNETQQEVEGRGGITGRYGTSTVLRTSTLFFRLLSLLFCAAALFLIVTNKQTTTVQFPGFFAFTKTATFTSSNAFVYLVVATAIGAAYAVVQVVDFIINGRGANARVYSLSTAWFVFILDQVLTYTILGAVAASTELAFLGKHGYEVAGWIEICSYFGKYCNQMGVAVVIAYLGTLCFAISSVFSAFGLFSRY